ncbi:M56 family metallopeptidase [Streptomyces mesophilus]|uniref:M56 family metallopeptidase n=1 Tax=Streptomyces mesophilus TaxID=1775132 RepID=UPI0033304D75
MSHILHFAAVLLCCLAVVRPLARARWTHAMPRTALLLWQAVGVTFELSALGLLTAMVFAPENQGTLPGLARLLAGPGAGALGPTAVVFTGLAALYLATRGGALAVTVHRTRARRRRHRHLLDLVARTDSSLPGVHVLDHPAPAAYCLPGADGRIVVTTGALALLDPAHLATVLAHERAHLRHRHDLVLLPFESWRRLLPANSLLETAIGAVRLLLEMSADDTCRRRLPGTDLAAALTHFAAAPATFPTPAGGFGVADEAVATRTARLSAARRPRPFTASVSAAALAVGGTLVSTPLSLFVLPF